MNLPREYPERSTQSSRPARGLPVTVVTVSHQRELMSMESLFNTAVESLAEMYGLDPGEDTADLFLNDSENITVTAEGIVRMNGGRMEIMYTEIFSEDGDSCDTVVSFDVSDPGTVAVTRSGEIQSALVLEKGKRHICAYETPYMPLEVCVWTLNVENEMTLFGGRIFLEYVVEIKGAAAQASKVEITVTP